MISGEKNKKNSDRMHTCIGSLDYCIALKFDRHIGSSAADVPVKSQSDRTILNTNLKDSVDIYVKYYMFESCKNIP